MSLSSSAMVAAAQDLKCRADRLRQSAVAGDSTRFCSCTCVRRRCCGRGSRTATDACGTSSSCSRARGAPHAASSSCAPSSAAPTTAGGARPGPPLVPMAAQRQRELGQGRWPAAALVEVLPQRYGLRGCGRHPWMSRRWTHGDRRWSRGGAGPGRSWRCPGGGQS